jgi:hypothetical protein
MIFIKKGTIVNEGKLLCSNILIIEDTIADIGSFEEPKYAE